MQRTRSAHLTVMMMTYETTALRRVLRHPNTYQTKEIVECHTHIHVLSAI